MNRVVALWVALCGAIISSTPTHAALQYSVGQTKDGTRYVLLEGEFEFSDDLSKLAQEIRTYRPEVITFHSNGGNVLKAIEVGRLIRLSKLGTMQPRGRECASACALAFFGGVSRVAEPGSIGMHKSSFSEEAHLNVDEAVSAVQELTAEVVAYMVEMGIDPALLQVALRYDKDDMRYLSKSEMVQYKVVTVHPAIEQRPSEPAEPPEPGPTVQLPEPSQPEPPRPEAPPLVEVTGRKVEIHPIAGDTRKIAWVYINVCSDRRFSDESLRELIDNHKFASMRVVAGKIDYFDPAQTRACAEVNVLKTYTHIRTRSQSSPVVAAAAELWTLIFPYGVRIDGNLGTLSREADDDFRFDIWLTSLPGPRSLPTINADRFSIPKALSGMVRHPNGKAKLKSAPNRKAADIRFFGNGTRVTIGADANGWYMVSALGLTGFMHQSWIRVDQFETAGYDDRYIQIVSFDNYAQAEGYVRESKEPLSVHLVSNSWFAVTLDKTFEAKKAQVVAEALKQSGDVPKDAFPTYGNTYVRQVCCNR